MKLIFSYFAVWLPAAIYAQVFSSAQWIMPPRLKDRVVIFTSSTQLRKQVQQAFLYVSAKGIYEASVNQKHVSESFFTPGFTNYDKRLQYQTYDVTGLLRSGLNELGVTLAGGWYSGLFGGDLNNNRYGEGSALLCQLDITYKDGSKQSITTDTSWRCALSAIESSDFYNGETYNAGFEPKDWLPVKAFDVPGDNLVPQAGPPVTKHETFAPVKIFTTPKGEQVVDFGQNMAGFVQLRTKGFKGDTVRVYHAEALDRDGNFYTGNLREAKAADTYILSGNDDVLEPHFTYHGFRYAKIEGFTPTPDNCKAIALYSDMQQAGTFSCSNELVNQLQSNINWSLNSNFVDIPTDCPQRSERLGWTGDAQIFCKTACFNRDTKLFYRKWLADLAADQGKDGAVPVIIPDIYHFNDSDKRTCAGWGDAATIIPWTLYQVYGDTALLETQYNSMKAWVDYIAARCEDGLWKDPGYGDWYAPGERTSLPYIDQCFFAQSTQLLVHAAHALHRTVDSVHYNKLLGQIKKDFVEVYVGSGGKAISHTQTAYVLALRFDMLPDSLQGKAVDYLVGLIHQNNDHLATGFLGTPYLLDVLSKYGHTDLAYTVLMQTSLPSWLYPVTKGATTIWEKWDAIKPDGSFDTCSLNHYAYGAVGHWLYENIGGIQCASPGYKHIRIAPQPGGGLSWAKASYLCKYGLIESYWEVHGKATTYHITIPSGTSARIELQGAVAKEVPAGSYTYTILSN